jgi:hypothetical protein
VKATFSTREASEELGVHIVTLQRHISRGTVDAPPLRKVGGVTIRLWTLRDVERARKRLSQVKIGRKRKKV